MADLGDSYGPNVRKKILQRNNNKQDADIITTLQDRHRYNAVHPKWDMSTHKFSILYYYTIQQNEGIQHVATSLHFLFTLSQSLSHNHRGCFTMLQYKTHSYYNAFL